jgi:hypothetical protein
MTEVETKQTEQEMSDDEAIMKIAQAMQGNAPTEDEKQSVYSFLHNVATAEDTTKVGNLRDDNELNELGLPLQSVRGALDMALISEKIIENDFFKGYFEAKAEQILATSLSRDGFLVRQATTQTKQVADVTKRRKINKGWFGGKKVEESGGDSTSRN